MIKRNRLRTDEFKIIIIFPIAALILALIMRLRLGSNVMFYAYHSHISCFPGREAYAFLYITRIILNSVMLGLIFACRDMMRKRAKVLIVTAFSFITILIEYKLLFFCESILTVVVMSVISIIMILRIIRKNSKCSCVSFEWIALASVLCFVQVYMIICILSIII